MADYQVQRELVRDDFAVRVWIENDFAVVSARPLSSAGPPDRPALPSRSRLLVWAGRQGMIRDWLRPYNRWTRFLSALRRRPCLTHDQQIERLTEELLAAISVFDPSSDDAWAAPGNRTVTSSVERGRLTKPGWSLPWFGGRGLNLLVAVGILATVAFGAVLAGAGPGGERTSASELPAVTIERSLR